MTVARGFGQNGKSYYTNVTAPSDINLQFTVTPSNGLGVTSVKSNGYVRNVFMHTSTTPSANDGYTNPNPADGFAVIQFTNNFNYYLSGIAQFIVPNTGSIKIDNSALTAGQVYVITTLGNASLAKWQAIGVPPGITPAVGVSFIALTNGGAGDTLTSRVSTPTTSGIVGVEVVGVPNTMIASSNIATNGGAWLTLQFMGVSVAGSGLTLTMDPYTPTGTVAAPVLTMDSYTPEGTNNGDTPPIFTGTPEVLTGTNSAPAFTGVEATLTGEVTGLSLSDTLVATAPATGTIVCLKLSYDRSSVTIGTGGL